MVSTFAVPYSIAKILISVDKRHSLQVKAGRRVKRRENKNKFFVSGIDWNPSEHDLQNEIHAPYSRWPYRISFLKQISGTMLQIRRVSREKTYYFCTERKIFSREAVGGKFWSLHHDFRYSFGTDSRSCIKISFLLTRDFPFVSPGKK